MKGRGAPWSASCNTAEKRSPCLKSSSWLPVLSALLLTLTGCSTLSERAACSTIPPWPAAGDEVAAELQTLPPDQYPALYNWMGRLLVYKKELDIITESVRNTKATD